MRIKHTDTEIYKVFTYLPNQGKLFKGIKRWFFWKSFRSKQSALKAIQRVKDTRPDVIENRLIFEIRWCPYPFATEEKCIVVYSEDYKEVEDNE